MTIHEAIDSGKPFRRNNGPWRYGLYPASCQYGHNCITVGGGCSHVNTFPYESANPICLTLNGYNATDWEIMPSEDDNASIALKLLNDLGIQVEETVDA